MSSSISVSYTNSAESVGPPASGNLCEGGRCESYGIPQQQRMKTRSFFLIALLILLTLCVTSLLLLYLEPPYTALVTYKHGDRHLIELVEETPFRCPTLFDTQRQKLHQDIIDQALDGIHPTSSPFAWFLMGAPGSGKTSAMKEILRRAQEQKSREGDSAVATKKEEEEEAEAEAEAEAGPGNVANTNREGGTKELDLLLWVDPDELLNQLPEYRMSLRYWDEGRRRFVAAKDAADACHGEAFHVAVLLAERAIGRGISIIYHGTGRNWTAYEALSKLSDGRGYRKQLLLTHCDLATSLQRVQRRGSRTFRFVPEAITRDIYPMVYTNFLRLHPLFERVWVYDSAPPGTLNNERALSLEIRLLWAKLDGLCYCGIPQGSNLASSAIRKQRLAPLALLPGIQLPCDRYWNHGESDALLARYT